MSKLVALDDLYDLLELVFLSAYLQGEKPVSAMLVAPVQAGKTELLQAFVPNPGILYMTSTTAYGIAQHHRQELMEGKVRHIIIPDFLSAIAKRWEQREAFFIFMSGLMEEGVGEIANGFHSWQVRSPYSCGFVTGLPPSAMMDNRHHWANIGLLSRMLPISWSYRSITVEIVAEYLKQLQHRIAFHWELSLPHSQIPVAISPEQVGAFWPVAKALHTSAEGYGFRELRSFERLACAAALRDGRTAVCEEDVQRVLRLSRYCNLSMQEI